MVYNQYILIPHEINITPRQVESRENLVDGLSEKDFLGLELSKQVYMGIPLAFVDILSQHMVCLT